MKCPLSNARPVRGSDMTKCGKCHRRITVRLDGKIPVHNKPKGTNASDQHLYTIARDQVS